MRFFAHESCGQCTPCREGTACCRGCRQDRDGRGERQDVDNVHQIARQMEMKTIAALADGAAMGEELHREVPRRFRRAVRG